MRILKGLLFLGLLSALGFLFWFIAAQDQDSNAGVSLEDNMILNGLSDSLSQSSTQPDSMNIVPTEALVVNAIIEDFEAKLDSNQFQIVKSSQLIFSRKIGWKVTQILASDLNGNQMPEFWIYGVNASKKSQILAFEYESGRIREIAFPKLKGRQAFGYAGGDSLYFEKNSLVRLVKYVNDPYADFGSGYRACFYTFGKDQSFILKKTLDLENLTYE
jgi:hypothetical protein